MRKHPRARKLEDTPPSLEEEQAQPEAIPSTTRTVDSSRAYAEWFRLTPEIESFEQWWNDRKPSLTARRQNSETCPLTE